MTTQNSRDQEPDIDQEIEREQRDRVRATRTRNMALGALGTGGIVALGAVLVLAGPTSDRTVISGGTESPTVAATPSARPAPPPTETLSGTPSPAPVGSPSPVTRRPPFRWHGKLTLNGPASDMDLDAVPPGINEQEADIYGAFLQPQIAAEAGNVQLSVFPNAGRLPTYAQCRDSVSRGGISRTQDLNPGDVVCVKTTDGRIARLKITRGVQTSTNPIVSMTATVWERP